MHIFRLKTSLFTMNGFSQFFLLGGYWIINLSLMFFVIRVCFPYYVSTRIIVVLNILIGLLSISSFYFGYSPLFRQYLPTTIINPVVFKALLYSVLISLSITLLIYGILLLNASLSYWIYLFTGLLVLSMVHVICGFFLKKFTMRLFEKKES